MRCPDAPVAAAQVVGGTVLVAPPADALRMLGMNGKISHKALLLPLSRGRPEHAAWAAKSCPLLPHRLLFNVIHHNHPNRALLLHQFQSKLFFKCLENRDAVGVRRFGDRSGRLVRIRSLRPLQHGFCRPSNQEVPPALQTGSVHNNVDRHKRPPVAEDSAPTRPCWCSYTGSSTPCS